MSFMIEIIRNLKISVHKPSTLIIDFKDSVEELYFIYKGSVVMCDKFADLSLVKLPAESYFGDF
jgi:signal-transduction protein with cAMP-binding, CBS, and nucleotidyltransferase domain